VATPPGAVEDPAALLAVGFRFRHARTYKTYGRTILSAMKVRTLSALVVAEVVSTTGTAMTFVVLPWFVLSRAARRRDERRVAVEIALMALLGIPSGSLIGRLGARTMLLSDARPADRAVPLPTGPAPLRGAVRIVSLLGTFTAPYITSQRLIILCFSRRRALLEGPAPSVGDGCRS
jgi:hypothetical protein